MPLGAAVLSDGTAGAAMPLGAAVLSDGTAGAVMPLGPAVLSDGRTVGRAVGTAVVGVVPDGGSGGWGIVALGRKNSPSLGWPAGGVASAKSVRAWFMDLVHRQTCLSSACGSLLRCM